MKKIFSLVAMIALLLISNVSFAAVGVRLNGTMVGQATDINFVCGTGTNSVLSPDGSLYNLNCSASLATTGVANGGVTSQVSSTAALATSFGYVRKVLDTDNNPLFTAGTLANGIPGQVLTVFAAGTSPLGGGTGGNYTITPTTSTGFVSIKLTATRDYVTFIYLDDTNGWAIMNYGGTVTINLKP